MSRPDDILTSSKSWRNQRRELGERNAGSRADEVAEGATGDFFDIKRPRLKYPQVLEKHTQPIQYAWDDPYQHMGRIGYARNTYQFRGTNKDDNNIYGSQHMKKTLWLEEMRRRIIAEQHGINADVDETTIAGTASAFYLNTREKRNKYLKRDNQVAQVWKIPTPVSSKKS